MKVARTRAEVRRAVAGARDRGGSVGLVATMGALHDGHLSLVRAARETTERVVLSLFVNPLQFGSASDLATYPRPESRDLALAQAAGVDLAFAPSEDEMYGGASGTTVAPGSVGEPLEGRFRPGHFEGVCTVVAKLFNLVGPDVAFFGQKDAQQAAVVKALVNDLSFSVRIVVCPTVREPDGVAISSRNRRLSEDERTRAPGLYEALVAGRDAVRRGDDRDMVSETMNKVLSAADVAVDYSCAVDPDTFEPAAFDGAVLLCVAGTLGSVRLIDNLLVEDA